MALETALLTLMILCAYCLWRLRRYLRARRRTPRPASRPTLLQPPFTLTIASPRELTVQPPEGDPQTVHIAWLDSHSNYPIPLQHAAAALITERLARHPQPQLRRSPHHPNAVSVRDPDGYWSDALVTAGLARWRPDTLPLTRLVTAAILEDRARRQRRGRWNIDSAP